MYHGYLSTELSCGKANPCQVTALWMCLVFRRRLSLTTYCALDMTSLVNSKQTWRFRDSNSKPAIRATALYLTNDILGYFSELLARPSESARAALIHMWFLCRDGTIKTTLKRQFSTSQGARCNFLKNFWTEFLEFTLSWNGIEILECAGQKLTSITEVGISHHCIC